MSNKITFRNANIFDSKLLYSWVNDPEVRKLSFDSNLVKWEDHNKWFIDKLNDNNYRFYVFENYKNEPIGQIRIQIIDDYDCTIGISIDSIFRGKGLGVEMLNQATSDFLSIFPKMTINAYIKSENLPSKFIFEKAGFYFKKVLVIKEFKCFHFIKYAN